MTGGERTMLIALFARQITNAIPLRVLDFGGACGFHYMAAQLLRLPLQWAVVETAAMAERAKDLENDELRFFSQIGAAHHWLGDSIDLVYSSSTLQYVPDPAHTLSQLILLNAPVLAWSRMALTDGEMVREMQTSRLSHNGPGPLPERFVDGFVEYPLTRFPKSLFLEAHHPNYQLEIEFDEPSQGFIFVRRDTGRS
jgi:putative methyltransferase (TIGR04325 family)